MLNLLRRLGKETYLPLSGKAPCGCAASCTEGSADKCPAGRSREAEEILLGYLRSSAPPDLRIPVRWGTQ